MNKWVEERDLRWAMMVIGADEDDSDDAALGDAAGPFFSADVSMRISSGPLDARSLKRSGGSCEGR